MGSNSSEQDILAPNPASIRQQARMAAGSSDQEIRTPYFMQLASTAPSTSQRARITSSGNDEQIHSAYIAPAQHAQQTSRATSHMQPAATMIDPQLLLSPDLVVSQTFTTNLKAGRYNVSDIDDQSPTAHLVEDFISGCPGIPAQVVSPLRKTPDAATASRDVVYYHDDEWPWCDSDVYADHLKDVQDFEALNPDRYKRARMTIPHGSYNDSIAIIGSYAPEGRTKDFDTIGFGDAESWVVLSEVLGGFEHVFMFDYFIHAMKNADAHELSTTLHDLPEEERALLEKRFKRALAKCKARGCRSILLVGEFISRVYRKVCTGDEADETTSIISRIDLGTKSTFTNMPTLSHVTIELIGSSAIFATSRQHPQRYGTATSDGKKHTMSACRDLVYRAAGRITPPTSLFKMYRRFSSVDHRARSG